MKLHILGIRHHGPGSAKNALAALKGYQPDLILVEGPPDAEPLLEYCADLALRPPVAMLAYVPENPRLAAFYPFAEFSPEWQAIRYAKEHGIAIRFMDMPLCHKFALAEEKQKQEEERLSAVGEELPQAEESDTEAEADEEHPLEHLHRHPFDYLAEIAGYEDGEEWWEQQVESMEQDAAVFEAVNDAIMSLREAFPDLRPEEAMREAFMRRIIRKAQKDGYKTICVICGAWHGPALDLEAFSSKEDDALLKNLPKTKVESTWVPWTYSRLSFESGYGAGVNSPGWYDFVWKQKEIDACHWMSQVASVFRKNGKDISSAHVIEAVKLTEALRSLRSGVRISLRDINESIQSVMCMGDSTPMWLIHKELIVGNVMGEVPNQVPSAPLKKDFDAKVKSLRIKIQDAHQLLQLDLRKETDLQRSVFFHRLQLLGIEWASQANVRGKGTFKEDWNLRWYPEIYISLAEKANWGNSIEEACKSICKEKAEHCRALEELTQLLKLALPADLGSSTDTLLLRMDTLAAGTNDINALIKAMLPLVEVYKYGDVRNTDKEQVYHIIQSVFLRTLVGLPLSCCHINEEQAIQQGSMIKDLYKAVQVLDVEEHRQDLMQCFVQIFEMDACAPFIAGLCCKFLYESKFCEISSIENAFSKSLSTSLDPALSAQWLEGFLQDAAMTLILDDGIWNIVYQWSSTLNDDAFVSLLPVLRRSFASYTSAQKNKIAQKVKMGKIQGASRSQTEDWDWNRAERCLPTIETLLL